MITAKITNRGTKRMGTILGKVARRSRNLKRVAKQFEDYTTDSRIPNMMRNQGRVMGPWGKGYRKWADNTPWVRRVKHDRRVFFKHNRSRSNIEEAYEFTGYAGPRSGKATFRLVNTHKAAKFLQAGFPRKVIRAKNARYLAIPWGFGRTIYRKQVTRGKMEPRRLDGFREGDEKKLIDLTTRDILSPLKGRTA